ncbi:MAG: RraA family protein [Alphaproteobacteria bacterium]|nr:RraA family protein [Alphaproteobacteria bacterium]
MDIGERLGRCYTGAIHDVLRDMGYERCVLPPTIAAIAPGMRVAGRIWTMAGCIDRRKTPHETLLAWTRFLADAPAGTVVICQPNTDEVALMGELSAETLQRRGVTGYIVDGGYRDVDFITRLGFPVFGRFATPADIVARWIPTAFGAQITIGGVTIRTGDYVLGDRDGVVILPQEVAEAAVTRAEAVVQTENLLRKAILDGVDPQAAYLKYGKF